MKEICLRKLQLMLKRILVVFALLMCFFCIASCDVPEEKTYFAVNFTAEEGGRIEGESTQNVQSGLDAKPVMAVPNEGYKFIKWSDGLTAQERIERSVTENFSVTAEFERIRFTVTYVAGEGGIIDGTVVQTVASMDSTDYVTAIPDDGYKFIEWSDGILEATRKDCSVAGDMRVTAIFAPSHFTATYIAGEGGKIQGEATQLVENFQETTQVTAVPDYGYKFVRWSDGYTKNLRSDILTKDITVTALFKRTIFNIEYVAGEGGEIQGELFQIVEWAKNSSPVTAVPDEGYKFIEWSDGVKTCERAEIAVVKDKTLTAIFLPINYSTITYSTDGNGGISGETAQNLAEGDTGSYVTAIPNEGYVFKKWSDGLTAIKRRDTATVNDKTFVAEFERIIYTVVFLSDENGTISGNGRQKVAHGDTINTVTALPKEGYRFIKWSDGVKTAERTDIVTQSFEVTAYFEIVYYTLHISYAAKGAEAFYERTYKDLKYGEEISCEPSDPIHNYDRNQDFHFIEWSDGVKTQKRTFRITCDIDLSVYYGVRVSYEVFQGVGGKIIGNLNQSFYFEDDATDVTAIPDSGYVFEGWSDKAMNNVRNDGLITYDAALYAHFEPIEKTFIYDYGKEYVGTPPAEKITLNRNRLQDVRFSVPSLEKYEFLGWYTDTDYTLKVADYDGRLMLGYYTFILETDRIYAKWKSPDDHTIVYKTLFTMTDEIHARLLSDVSGEAVTVDYKMSSIERRILGLIPTEFSSIINECFGGKVIFECDAYFTTVPLGSALAPLTENDFDMSTFVRKYYILFPNKIPEVAELLDNYRSILNTFAMNDYECLLIHNGVGGAATNCSDLLHLQYNYAALFLDNMFNELYYRFPINRLPMIYSSMVDPLDESSRWMDTYFHEFTHTLELFLSGRVYAYHLVVDGTDSEQSMARTKKYLLGEYEVDGKFVGIPSAFWTRPDLTVSYKVEGDGGVLAFYPDSGPNYTSITTIVSYADDFEIWAVAKEGYRFVGWSDGYKDVWRYDYTIISEIDVYAIFEKIEI